jgi:hypothetical protein
VVEARPFEENALNKTLRPSLAVAFARACARGHAQATQHCGVELAAQDAFTIRSRATPPEPASCVTLARFAARVAEPASTFARDRIDRRDDPRAAARA